MESFLVVASRLVVFCEENPDQGRFSKQLDLNLLKKSDKKNFEEN
jgi:hypothetical protein